MFHLSNQIHLEGKLFGFKMSEHKSIDDNLDEFNRIVIDLEVLGKDKAILIPKLECFKKKKNTEDCRFSGRQNEIIWGRIVSSMACWAQTEVWFMGPNTEASRT